MNQYDKNLVINTLMILILVLVLVGVAASMPSTAVVAKANTDIELAGRIERSSSYLVPRLYVEESSDELVPVGCRVLIVFDEDEALAPGLYRGDDVELKCEIEYWNGWSIRGCRMVTPIVGQPK